MYVNIFLSIYLNINNNDLVIEFHITQAIYMIPIAAAAQKPRSIPWQLQRLFYEMQSSTRAPDTKGMNFDAMQ